MSVPQPWPRRPPVLLGVLAALAVVSAVVNFAGIAQQGPSTFRWVLAVLWSALAVLCFLAWRRQVRRFNDRAAELQRSAGPGEGEDDRRDAGPPSA
ncbi:hypothetical protein [Microlunatus flavus]|uniref:Uncharacterized protein n=1 Tax=Microlunatus flavus TaxID=1036181 RepID=A0A1H9H5Q7_9ACTN|nr:hypothetical protein [Microlunatus flavus]SEQ57567.1 hypothetical protein SAMN05421756_104127 [Microlunatus flavus]